MFTSQHHFAAFCAATSFKLSCVADHADANRGRFQARFRVHWYVNPDIVDIKFYLHFSMSLCLARAVSWTERHTSGNANPFGNPQLTIELDKQDDIRVHLRMLSDDISCLGFLYTSEGEKLYFQTDANRVRGSLLTYVLTFVTALSSRWAQEIAKTSDSYRYREAYFVRPSVPAGRYTLVVARYQAGAHPGECVVTASGKVARPKLFPAPDMYPHHTVLTGALCWPLRAESQWVVAVFVQCLGCVRA